MSSCKRVCSQSLPGPSRDSVPTAVKATARKSIKTNVVKATARKTLSLPSSVGHPRSFQTPSKRPLIHRISPQAPRPAVMAPVVPLQVLPPDSPPLPVFAVVPVAAPPAVRVAQPAAVRPVLPPAVRPILPVAVRPVQAAVPALAPVVPQQPLRRSSRRRFPPMKFWEGERLRYVRDPNTGLQSLVHFATYFHPAP